MTGPEFLLVSETGSPKTLSKRGVLFDLASDGMKGFQTNPQLGFIVSSFILTTYITETGIESARNLTQPLQEPLQLLLLVQSLFGVCACS